MGWSRVRQSALNTLIEVGGGSARATFYALVTRAYADVSSRDLDTCSTLDTRVREPVAIGPKAEVTA